MKLIERLKIQETELNELKYELNLIQIKLEGNYKYQDELESRVLAAQTKTNGLRDQFFIKCGEISTKINQMKETMNIYTGNFYKEFVGCKQN